jgi:hypothetical protein
VWFVVVVEEEEWLKSSSAAKNTTKLGWRRSCTRPKRYLSCYLSERYELWGAILDRETPAGMRIPPCTIVETHSSTQCGYEID